MQQDKLITSASPHIFDSINKKRIMYSVILALMPAAIAGIIIFGWYPLLVVLVSIASAVLTEAIIQKRLKKKITVSDGSAVITGLLLALTLPPNVPLWLPVVGAAFAISIAKWAFGGSGNVMFNPEWQPTKAPPEQGQEACYSVPKRIFKVNRAPYGWAKWTNIDGKPFEDKLTGIPAIVFQHELNHLDGICCIDIGEEIKINSA